jgi:hypothetical protein
VAAKRQRHTHLSVTVFAARAEGFPLVALDFLGAAGQATLFGTGIFWAFPGAS